MHAQCQPVQGAVECVQRPANTPALCMPACHYALFWKGMRDVLCKPFLALNAQKSQRCSLQAYAVRATLENLKREGNCS
eukprot:1157407-Pelagomonas_calceolata.AAC.6